MSEPKEIKKKCQCQPFPQWAKWLTLILMIAIFIMCCFLLHYLWKLSDIWQAIKNSK